MRQHDTFYDKNISLTQIWQEKVGVLSYGLNKFSEKIVYKFDIQTFFKCVTMIPSK